MKTRLDALRGLIAEQGLDCLIVSQPENRRYMSGFSGSAGVLLVSAEQALILTDFRYYIQAAQQASDYTLVPAPSRTEQTLAQTIQLALSDPIRLRDMGAASFQLVDQEINLEKMVETFVQALNAVQLPD